MTTLLQFDFPFDGPFGAEMTAALSGLAHDIAAEDGLIWKIWTENEAEGRAGGIYLFADPLSAARYADKHKARLEGFGVTGIVARSFVVNADLSAITRAPL
ncbi:monooxygenase [Rhizobium sp. KAs_5_22]|uniref:monooxygenase n=1 Tax=Ciceribacter selenitireducens TaxID=448181 RepID=UPI00048F2FED|nr:monooxygenase [Ciceribacter selenitireducens]PPJ47544.1 monooxygenase [Rhizobium sp. KAs_5_22]